MLEIDKIKNALRIEIENGFFTKNEVNIPSEYLKKTQHGYILSKSAREKIKVGLCGGVFDIIHVGHVEFLKYCKSQVDFLVVVVAKDHTVYKRKNKAPIFPEKDRKHIVEAIRYVDSVIIGSEIDMKETIKKVSPDIIILGKDQNMDEVEIQRALNDLSLPTKIIRSSIWREDIHAKSSRIKEKIKITHSQ